MWKNEHHLIISLVVRMQSRQEAEEFVASKLGALLSETSEGIVFYRMIEKPSDELSELMPEREIAGKSLEELKGEERTTMATVKTSSGIYHSSCVPLDVPAEDYLPEADDECDFCGNLLTEDADVESDDDEVSLYDEEEEKEEKEEGEEDEEEEEKN